MSLVYGVWRPEACKETVKDCAFLHRCFSDWKCDYQGTDQMGPAAFGSHLFRIYPESKNERQPLKVERQKVMLVADCRLDNRDELTTALGIDNVDAKKTPDSALILAAYDRWGKGCFKRLEGDFALALWDQRKQELLLVRDVTGVRPLAYATWPGGAAFCSSIPELYKLPSVPSPLDDIQIAALLATHASGRERTPFEAIKWVPPGAIVTLRDERVNKEAFASINPIPLTREEQRNPAPRLAELLQQSVRKRLRGESDVICELSGGFDSGTVTALAARMLQNNPRQLRAISWTPSLEILPLINGPDERRQILWMERHYGIRCHYFPFWTNEESLDSISFRSSFRERAANAIGSARTILSGWGGDECVTFYLRSFHPQALLRDGTGAAIKRLSAELLDSRIGFLRAPIRLARSLKGIWNASRQERRFHEEKRSLINPLLKDEWREALATAHGDQIYRDLLPNGTHDCMDRLLTRGHLELRASKESLDAARIGVEMAYPMLDVHLLAFMSSLEARHFDYGSQRRRFFRAALDFLDLKLAPKTRKQEEALSTQSQQSPCYPHCPKPVLDEFNTLQAQFLKAPDLNENGLLTNKYRHMQIRSIVSLFLKKTSN